MTTPRLRFAPGISESDFQESVMDLARITGWRVVHIPVGMVRGRHMTAYKGHAGLPDLILAREGVVLLVELKSEKGKVSLDQQAWIDAAHPFGYVWAPRDWPEVEEVLTNNRAA